MTEWASTGISGLGTSKWFVYASSGSGFQTSTGTWSTPDLGTDELDHLHDANGGDPSWVLLDLDADGASELVLTEWSSSGISSLGTTSWLVYDNMGSGHDTSASSWTLPDLGSGELEKTYDSTGSGPTFALLDLDGNGGVDLVVTEWASSGVSDLGTTKWWHYANSCP